MGDVLRGADGRTWELDRRNLRNYANDIVIDDDIRRARTHVGEDQIYHAELRNGEWVGDIDEIFKGVGGTLAQQAHALWAELDGVLDFCEKNGKAGKLVKAEVRAIVNAQNNETHGREVGDEEITAIAVRWFNMNQPHQRPVLAAVTTQGRKFHVDLGFLKDPKDEKSPRLHKRLWVSGGVPPRYRYRGEHEWNFEKKQFEPVPIPLGRAEIKPEEMGSQKEPPPLPYSSRPYRGAQ